MLFNNVWSVFILSMLPFTELRATIPWAIAVGLSPGKAFGLAVAGNLLPVFPLLRLLQPLEKSLNYVPRLGSLFQDFLGKTRLRGEQIREYGLGGLFLFVLIPLPGTGAWSGALLAWLLGFPFLSAGLMICLGVCGAGLLVTLASIGFLQIVHFSGIEIIILMICLILLCFLKGYKK